jgi:hypothetical protein
MELDLQSLFGLHVISLHLDSYTRTPLVSKDRLHLFVTPWLWTSSVQSRNSHSNKIQGLEPELCQDFETLGL